MKYVVCLVLLLCSCKMSEQEAAPMSPPFTYAPASKERVLSYPRDFGAHRDTAYEWWYLTGFFDGDDGSRRGLQVTLFRFSPFAGPRKDGNGYLMVQFALSDLETSRFVQRAYISEERTDVFSLSDDDLDIEVPGLRLLRSDEHTIDIWASFAAEGAAYSISGSVAFENGPVLHGEKGFSKKGACGTCASHYVSLPRLTGAMTLTEEGRVRSGKASLWYDQEFGSNTLSADQAGWEWFSIRLFNGNDTMVFRLRGKDGAQSFTSGTLIDRFGQSEAIEPRDIEVEPIGEHRYGEYPLEWRIKVRAEEYVVRAIFPEQEVVGHDGMPSYWEGACEVLSASGERTGLAYAELTGYREERGPMF